MDQTPPAGPPSAASHTDTQLTDTQLTADWLQTIEAFLSLLVRLSDDLYQKLDLTGPWYEVLLRLYSAPDRSLPTTELARRSAFSSGGFTKIADRMVARGLIERRPSATDRRSIFLTLTGDGEELVNRAIAHQAEELRTLVVQPIGADRFSQLVETLQAIRNQVGGISEASAHITSGATDSALPPDD